MLKHIPKGMHLISAVTFVRATLTPLLVRCCSTVPDKMSKPRVFFDMEAGGKGIGRIVMEVLMVAAIPCRIVASYSFPL